MTRDEASALLGIPADTPASAVRQRFEELHNEYHVRLTNAPTPALKKVYQRNLQELQEACRSLVPGFEVATTQDLPTAEPIHGVEVRTATRRMVPEAPPPAAAVPRDGGLPSAAKWAIIAAAVCATLATLFGLLWQRDAREATRMRQELAGAQAKLAQVSAVTEQFQKLLKTAPLKICNESSRPVRIASAVAVYAEPDGSVRSVYSGSFNYPTWDIRPGGRETLTIMRGRPNDWDGTAALYSLLVEYPGAEPYLVAGLMSNHKNGCVNLAFD